MKGNQMLISFPELVTLSCRYKLPWGKMVGFVRDGMPTMNGKNNVAAN
jgi:hypothetical protein